MPNLYVIGGANGSGKTTVAKQLLPSFSPNFEYVNADEIAAGLSPFNPESVAIQAGRLMLERLRSLKSAKVDFAFETTLAARTFAPFLRKCQNEADYTINLLYFWLSSPNLAVNRVARRVEAGGHNIPVEVIRRRYDRGRKNFIELYLPLADRWIVYDNSRADPELVAERPKDGIAIIYQTDTWNQINTANP
ncbi:MAG: zeta toxin family protein [Prochloraceae cyanobacterium]